MSNRNDGAEPYALPDFGSDGASSSPAAPHGPDPDPAQNPPGGSGGARWVLLGIGAVVILLVLVLVIGLVLWQTVFSNGADPTQDPGTPVASQEPEDEERTKGEYIPSEEQTTQPEPQDGPTMTVNPSVECGVYPIQTDQEQPTGELRGGGLSVPLEDSWEPLSSGEQAMMQDSAMAWSQIRNGWYSTATIGRVTYTDEEGGYPGAQTAARHIFECDITTDDSITLFGDVPEVTNLSEEATTIDGHEAHVLQADVAILDDAGLRPTTQLRYLVIVVETPDGPSALVVGAATDLDAQVADQQAMREQLAVTE